jgi:hypothetical protein
MSDGHVSVVRPVPLNGRRRHWPTPYERVEECRDELSTILSDIGPSTIQRIQNVIRSPLDVYVPAALKKEVEAGSVLEENEVYLLSDRAVHARQDSSGAVSPDRAKTGALRVLHTPGVLAPRQGTRPDLSLISSAATTVPAANTGPSRFDEELSVALLRVMMLRGAVTMEELKELTPRGLGPRVPVVLDHFRSTGRTATHSRRHRLASELDPVHDLFRPTGAPRPGPAIRAKGVVLRSLERHGRSSWELVRSRANTDVRRYVIAALTELTVQRHVVQRAGVYRATRS